MKRKKLMILAWMLAMTSVEAAEPSARRPDVERMAHACSGCHGAYGHSQSPTPAIAGKPEEDFIIAMREFKSKERLSSIMNRIAEGYTEEDFVAMARFFKNR